jgi:hypothetical protein
MLSTTLKKSIEAAEREVANPPANGLGSRPICQAFMAAVQNGNRRDALDALVLGLKVDEHGFLAAARRDGALRASKYRHDAAVLTYTVGQVVEGASTLGLTDSTIGYLRSVHSLLFLADPVRELEQIIDRSLADQADTVLKDLIATVDFLFMVGHQQDTHQPSSNIRHYAAEELSDSASSLLMRFVEHHPITTERLSFMNDEAVAAGARFPLLIAMAQVRLYGEWEVLVERFGYVCRYDPKKRRLKIAPPDERTGKAIRYGFIQTEHQQIAALMSPEVQKAPRLEDFARRFHRDTQHLFRREEHPFSRVVFQFPAHPKIGEFLKTEALFQEEAATFRSAMKDMVVGLDELRSLVVRDPITIWDVVKVQRLFAMLGGAAAAHLQSLVEEDPLLVLRSELPVFPVAALEQQIALVVEPEKTRHLLDLLTWKPGGTRPFDLLYQPLIRAGDHILFPLNVWRRSQVLRNTLALTQERVHKGKPQDPAETLLANALGSRIAQVKTNVGYNYQSAAGDIDVAALIGDTLFVFEVKNALTPTSVWELRTSVDHIEKAAKQLDRIVHVLGTPGGREHVGRRLGWDLNQVRDVVTGIAMTNRMLAGYQANGHPVRALYELANFVVTGQGSFAGQPISLWPATGFSADALRDYLRNDTFLERTFSAMRQRRDRYRFGKITAELRTYELPMEALARNLGVEL